VAVGVDGQGKGLRLDGIQLNASTPIGQFGAKNYEAAIAIIVPRYMGQSRDLLSLCVLHVHDKFGLIYRPGQWLSVASVSDTKAICSSSLGIRWGSRGGYISGHSFGGVEANGVGLVTDTLAWAFTAAGVARAAKA